MYLGDYVSAGLAAASSFTQTFLGDQSPVQTEVKEIDYYQRNLNTVKSIYNLTIWPSTSPLRLIDPI